MAKKGLENRLENFILKKSNKKKEELLKIYEDRLSHETNIINSMDYASYFLIVSDYIKWAKKNSIPVGPGRGSGAGSLVAYCLDITDLDPIEFDLIFERFLNQIEFLCQILISTFARKKEIKFLNTLNQSTKWSYILSLLEN